MKVTVIDRYSSLSGRHKDPITLPLSLIRQGFDVELVSTAEAIPDKLFELPLHNVKDWLRAGFQADRPDVVISFSRFDPRLTWILRVIKAGGVPLIVKGDTDGTLGYPLVPNYLRSRPVSAHPMNILRQFKWRNPWSGDLRAKLFQVSLADYVVCESPAAAANLTEILFYWRKHIDVKKIKFIPNAVSLALTNVPVSAVRKKTIVCIGRWNDELIKGSDLLAGVINRYSEICGTYTFVVIGNGAEKIEARLTASGREKTKFLGEISFEKCRDCLLSATTLLVPSRLESFSLVSAEALCAGASIVVTPIESLIYLAGGGQYGSIARNFEVPALLSALVAELKCSDAGERNPLQIANYWRGRLSEDHISADWIKLLKCATAR